MYNVNSNPIHNNKSTIYIATSDGDFIDENLNQYAVYEKPKKYRFNVQTITSDSEIREFGEIVNQMKVISITEKAKYINKFHEFDRVYIDSKPNNEFENGYNADYYIYSVRNQNTSIRIFIKKLVK